MSLINDRHLIDRQYYTEVVCVLTHSVFVFVSHEYVCIWARQLLDHNHHKQEE